MQGWRLEHACASGRREKKGRQSAHYFLYFYLKGHKASHSFPSFSNLLHIFSEGFIYKRGNIEVYFSYKMFMSIPDCRIKKNVIQQPRKKREIVFLGKVRHYIAWASQRCQNTKRCNQFAPVPKAKKHFSISTSSLHLNYGAKKSRRSN